LVLGFGDEILFAVIAGAGENELTSACCEKGKVICAPVCIVA
jgi:hypothetical protein